MFVTKNVIRMAYVLLEYVILIKNRLKIVQKRLALFIVVVCSEESALKKERESVLLFYIAVNLNQVNSLRADLLKLCQNRKLRLCKYYTSSEGYSKTLVPRGSERPEAYGQNVLIVLFDGSDSNSISGTKIS